MRTVEGKQGWMVGRWQVEAQQEKQREKLTYM